MPPWLADLPASSTFMTDVLGCFANLMDASHHAVARSAASHLPVKIHACVLSGVFRLHRLFSAHIDPNPHSLQLPLARTSGLGANVEPKLKTSINQQIVALNLVSDIGRYISS